MMIKYRFLVKLLIFFKKSQYLFIKTLKNYLKILNFSRKFYTLLIK